MIDKNSPAIYTDNHRHALLCTSCSSFSVINTKEQVRSVLLEKERDFALCTLHFALRTSGTTACHFFTRDAGVTRFRAARLQAGANTPRGDFFLGAAM